VNTAAQVPGDRDLLFQAFANLLDNAIKYTPPQGYIKVDLSEQNEQPWITFTDSGPGIPQQERDKIFQRFYRLEQSRGTPGNGLGLSLVAAVAKLHDIKLKVKDNAPGFKFVLVFTQSGS
jgi:signal transduction histidine kinase